MNSLVVLFSLFFVAEVTISSAARGDIDSVGTEFVTVFSLNCADDIAVDTKNALVFLNADHNSSATVRLSYIAYSSVITESHTVYDEIRVARQTVLQYLFKDIVMNEEHLEPGPNYMRDYRVYISSSLPITVLQHSYVNNGSGDTFMVLPMSMAGKYFSFSTASTKGNTNETTIHFLPVRARANIEIVSVSSASKHSPQKTVMTAELGRYMALYKSESDDVTYHIKSDEDMNLVVAIQLTPEPNSTNPLDFGAFMPFAIPDRDGREISSDDYHFASIPNESEFSLAAPFANSTAFDVVFSSDDGQSQSITVEPEQAYPVVQFEQNFGESIQFYAQKTVMQIVRFGNGVYADSVPSLSQFVTGSTMFSVLTDDNEVIIFGDRTTAKSAKLDGKKLRMIAMEVEKPQIYYVIKTLLEGVHTLSSDGLYMIMVSGMHGPASYAYVPLLNKIEISFAEPTTTTTTISPSPNVTTTTKPVTTTTPITTTPITTTPITTTVSPTTPHNITVSPLITTTKGATSPFARINLFSVALTILIALSFVRY